MKYLAILISFTFVACTKKQQVEITPGSPQHAVHKYYRAARAGNVDESNSYVSSYDHKKFERFPENRTAAVNYISKNEIEPTLDGVKTLGRFSAVSIAYLDPHSQKRRERLEYILVVQEEETWKLVQTSRPYIDEADWDITPQERQDIRDLEAWYEERKRQFK